MMQNTCCVACGFSFYSTIANLKCPNCKKQIGIAQANTGDHASRQAAPYPMRNHWFPLHEYAPKHAADWDKRSAIEFLNRWSSNIPGGCGCGDDFDELRRTLPPVYRSPKEFAKRAWEWHDAVSRRIGKPRVKWADYLASWWNEVSPVRPNLLITVATGKALEHWSIVRPSFEHYARRINADLIAIVNAREAWWGYEKFRIQQFVPLYERTIFADCDIVITPRCEDLISLVPPHRVGIHDDWKKLPTHSWMEQELRDVCESQKWKPIRRGVCANSGLVVCSRHHRVWQPPAYPLPIQHHCAEQFYVEQNILRRGYEVQWLPTAMNTQWWMPDYNKLKQNAQIIHLANSPSKVKDLTAAMQTHFAIPRVTR